MDPELVRLVAVAMGGFLGMAGIIAWGITNVARSKALAAQNRVDGPDPERIEDLEARVAELEERVDFTERLLGENKRDALGP